MATAGGKLYREVVAGSTASSKHPTKAVRKELVNNPCVIREMILVEEGNGYHCYPFMNIVML
jgi:hypothetical protein